MVILIVGIPVGICQGFHGDDGSRTTQLVFVFYGDARCFGDGPCSGFAWFVAFAVPATTTWSANEGGLHGERVVGDEFFVGIQFDRERLEIGVESFTPFFEFAHGEGGGLEGVREGPGLQGQMDSGVWLQGVVFLALSLEGT